MKNILLLISITLLFQSCKKDRLVDEKEALIGTWEWKYSEHDYGWCNNMSFTEELSPQSEQHVFEIEFSIQGYVSFYDNGELLRKKRIVFNHFEKIDNDDVYFIIHPNNKKEDVFSGFIETMNDEMLITGFPYSGNESCENYKNYFIKQ